MTAGSPLDLTTWLIAFAPIAVLLATILLLRWNAAKAAGLAWLVAVSAGALVFGGTPTLLALACAKGLSLSRFVLLIVWSAVFLYNVADHLGAIRVIGRAVTSLAEDRLLCALLVAWAFAGFLQGIAGFGVPVAVVTPLMLFAGFTPVVAVVSVMVGHSWAITFGSMASSYFAILLVTGLPPHSVALWTAGLAILPIFLVGLSVAHLNGGIAGVKRTLLPITVSSALMSGAMFGIAWAGAVQIASIVPGLVGVGAIAAFSRLSSRACRPSAVAACPAEASPSPAANVTTGKGSDLSFHMAFLPYYVLIGLSILSQVPIIREATAGLAWGFDYPAVETTMGFQVAAMEDFAPIRLFNHPAPLIAISTVVTFAVYRARGNWPTSTLREAGRLTYIGIVPTSIAISLLVMMALVMIDTGMALLLARGMQVTGHGFPVLSPFIGVLGAFITGSNTNSNVMFGALQQQTAEVLGFAAVIMAAAQSVGGALGAGVSPDKALIGAAIIGEGAQESTIMRRALPYTLLMVLALGLEVLVLALLFSNGAT